MYFGDEKATKIRHKRQVSQNLLEMCRSNTRQIDASLGIRAGAPVRNGEIRGGRGRVELVIRLRAWVEIPDKFSTRAHRRAEGQPHGGPVTIRRRRP